MTDRAAIFQPAIDALQADVDALRQQHAEAKARMQAFYDAGDEPNGTVWNDRAMNLLVEYVELEHAIELMRKRIAP